MLKHATVTSVDCGGKNLLDSRIALKFLLYNRTFFAFFGFGANSKYSRNSLPRATVFSSKRLRMLERKNSKYLAEGKYFQMDDRHFNSYNKTLYTPRKVESFEISTSSQED